LPENLDVIVCSLRHSLSKSKVRAFIFNKSDQSDDVHRMDDMERLDQMTSDNIELLGQQ